MRYCFVLCVLLGLLWANDISTTRVFFDMNPKGLNPACVETFLKLIKQSSYDFHAWDSKNKGAEWIKEHISFEFDTWNDESIKVKLFFDYKDKDFQGTGTITWLEFDRKKQILQDLLQEKDVQFNAILANSLESCTKHCDFSKTLALQQATLQRHNDEIDSMQGEIVGKGRAYFYSAPNKYCKLDDLFLIPKDRVELLGRENNFSFVSYKRKNSESIKLWIESERLRTNELD